MVLKVAEGWTSQDGEFRNLGTRVWYAKQPVVL